MSDDIELGSGESVPIQETVCDGAHVYYEHEIGTACEVVGCGCPSFIAAWDTRHLRRKDVSYA